jgi:hypothetical protein
MTINKWKANDNYLVMLRLRNKGYRSVLDNCEIARALNVDLAEFEKLAMSYNGQLVEYCNSGIEHYVFNVEKDIDNFIDELNPYLIMAKLTSK